MGHTPLMMALDRSKMASAQLLMSMERFVKGVTLHSFLADVVLSPAPLSAAALTVCGLCCRSHMPSILDLGLAGHAHVSRARNVYLCAAKGLRRAPARTARTHVLAAWPLLAR